MHILFSIFKLPFRILALVLSLFLLGIIVILEYAKNWFYAVLFWFVVFLGFCIAFSAYTGQCSQIFLLAIPAAVAIAALYAATLSLDLLKRALAWLLEFSGFHPRMEWR